MSGATAFSRPVPKIGPIEERLRLEDNKRITRFIGTGQVAGAWFLAWALTVQVLIPADLYPPADPLPPDFKEPPKISFVLPPKHGPEQKPIKRPPHENNGPKATSRNPVKVGGQIKVAEIASKGSDMGKKAYEILRNAMKAVDMAKVEGAERLTKTDPTFIGGRRGIKRDSYDGYGPGDGTSTEIDLTPGTPPGRIDGGPLKGPSGIAELKASEITTSQEGKFRSSESILAVVRAHSPGLRHLYNTHLKSNPGLGGKVTVRFAISPSGRVVDAAIVSGTTGSRAFEIQVVEKIQAWHFDPIKTLGNDIVTVPFNFSE